MCGVLCPQVGILFKTIDPRTREIRCDDNNGAGVPGTTHKIIVICRSFVYIFTALDILLNQNLITALV